MDDHVGRVADLALDILRELEDNNVESNPSLNARIGTNSGGAVAGVIGKREFVFDLWGNVAGLASRMESHGLPREIQAR